MSAQLAEFDQLKAQIAVFVEPTSQIVVADAASNSIASGTLKTLKELKKQVENRRVAAVKPHNDVVDEINLYAKKISEPLNKAIELVNTRMGDYAIREQNRRAEEEKKRQEELRVAREKAEAEQKRLADEAKAKHDAEMKRLRDEQEAKRIEAEKKAKADEAARLAFGLKADAEKQEDLFKQKAIEQEQQRKNLELKLEQDRIAAQAKIDREREQKEREIANQRKQEEQARPKNVRMVPKHKIVDIALVPKEFWMINETALGAAVRGGRKDIPGVEIWEEPTVVSR